MVEGGLSVSPRLASLASGCRMVLMPIFKALSCRCTFLAAGKLYSGGEIVVTERAFGIHSHPPSFQIEWDWKGV